MPEHEATPDPPPPQAPVLWMAPVNPNDRPEHAAYRAVFEALPIDDQLLLLARLALAANPTIMFPPHRLFQKRALYLVGALLEVCQTPAPLDRWELVEVLALRLNRLRQQYPCPTPAGERHSSKALALVASPEPTDYDIVVEAIEEYLRPFIFEDDVAECAIYADAIKLAGKHIDELETRARATMARTGTCPLCNAPSHAEECPLYQGE